MRVVRAVFLNRVPTLLQKPALPRFLWDAKTGGNTMRHLMVEGLAKEGSWGEGSPVRLVLGFGLLVFGGLWV